jgi:hypothetical protein
VALFTQRATSAQISLTSVFQIRRFLRRSILFYDAHPVDLYQLIRSLYFVRMKGVETKDEAHGNLSSVLDPTSEWIKPIFQPKGPFWFRSRSK